MDTTLHPHGNPTTGTNAPPPPKLPLFWRLLVNTTPPLPCVVRTNIDVAPATTRSTFNG